MPQGDVKSPIQSTVSVHTKSRTAGLREFEAESVSRFLEKKYRATESFRAQYYPSWYEALAFLQNEHYTQFLPNIGYYEAEKPSQETYRAVINYITGAHGNLIAKTTKNKPRVTFSPIGSGSIREDAIRFMRQVDEYLHHRLTRERVFEECLAWAFSIGMGFDKSYWDPNAGDIILSKKIGTTSDEERREYYEDLEDTPFPVFKRQMTGEIIHESRSGFEIGWDPFRTFHESPYVYEQQVWHMEEFRESFEDSFNKVRPSGDIEYLPGEFWKVHLMQNLAALGSASSYSGPVSGVGMAKNKARIIEWWEKPNDVWPEGALFHWTPDHDKEDNGVLNVQVCPFAIDDPESGAKRIWQWNPYSMFFDVPIPGKSIPMGSVQFGIPIQQMLDREASSIQEFINLAAKYRILVQEGQGEIDRDEFQDHHMNFVHVKGDPKSLQPMPTPQMSLEVKEMRSWLEKAFDKVMRQTLDDEAQAVRSGLSGDAIEYLDALQQVKMLPNIAMYVRGLCRTSRHQLLLAKKHYGDDPLINRFITITGRGGAARVRNFDSNLIAMDFTTICEGTSELSRSVAARKAEILKYYNAGAFGPIDNPDAQRRLLKLSEFAQVDDVYEDIAVTENLVNNRLDAILDNQNDIDDGPWHFEDHDESIKMIDIYRRKYYGQLSQVQRQRVDYLSAKHQFLKGQKDALQASSIQSGADAAMGGSGSGGGMEGDEDATNVESQGVDGSDMNKMSTLDSTEDNRKYARDTHGEA